MICPNCEKCVVIPSNCDTYCNGKCNLRVLGLNHILRSHFNEIYTDVVEANGEGSIFLFTYLMQELGKVSSCSLSMSKVHGWCDRLSSYGYKPLKNVEDSQFLLAIYHHFCEEVINTIINDKSRSFSVLYFIRCITVTEFVYGMNHPILVLPN